MKRTLAFLLGILFVVSLCACGGEAWPTSGLGAMLPKPSSGSVESVNDFGDSFSASVKNPAQDEFEKYIAACKEKGFTVDADESDDYIAFNEEGYKLKVVSYSSSMHIDLDKPIELGTLKWPNSELGKAVPKPSSEKGTVKWEHEDSFLAYVGDMNIDDFDDYADTCFEAGYSVDYDRSDRHYSAYDEEGRYINIKYYGFNIVSIEAEIPDDEEEQEETTAKKSGTAEKEEVRQTEQPVTEKAVSANGEVTPAFKEMMDDYESFMDDYVAFMKKYQNSDDTLGMLEDYNTMMADYAEYMKKVNAVDTDTLSEADLAYYLEVTGRVNKKLASIGEDG